MSTRYYTAPEVADMLVVNPGKILSWIRSGELRATNVAASLIGRPRWRVSPADLAVFKARRAAGPPPPKTRPRRKTVGVIQFF